MEDFVKLIQSLIPFLDPYPFWVKAFLSAWVIGTAILLLCLLFVPRVSIPEERSAVMESSPPEASPLPDMPSSSAVPAAKLSVVNHIPVPDNFAPISAEKVLSTLKDKDLTELQKKQFMDTYKGRIVRWEAVVLDVKSGSSSSMFLVFRPATDHSQMPEVIVASFSSAHEKDLLNLKKGQSIVIDGVLKFLSTGVGPSPALDDAQIVQLAD